MGDHHCIHETVGVLKFTPLRAWLYGAIGPSLLSCRVCVCGLFGSVKSSKPLEVSGTLEVSGPLESLFAPVAEADCFWSASGVDGGTL
jgi:hypothetical protein